MHDACGSLTQKKELKKRFPTQPNGVVAIDLAICALSGSATSLKSPEFQRSLLERSPVRSVGQSETEPRMSNQERVNLYNNTSPVTTTTITTTLCPYLLLSFFSRTCRVVQEIDCPSPNTVCTHVLTGTCQVSLRDRYLTFNSYLLPLMVPCIGEAEGGVFEAGLLKVSGKA